MKKNICPDDYLKLYKAFKKNPSHKNLENLGTWLRRYERSWNGESWPVKDENGKPDGIIKPVYDFSKWNEEDGEFQDEYGVAIDGQIGFEYLPF